MQIINLGMIAIKPNRQRQEFDPVAMQELADSIRTIGLLNPLVVSMGADGHIYLVAGERRLRVLTDLYALGHKIKCGGKELELLDVPTLTMGELSELEAEEAELDENLKRSDLTWQEETAAKSRLLKLRQAQATEKGETFTVTDLAEELTGQTEGSYRANVNKSLVVAKHLDNPKIQKAKSVNEAYKILEAEETREKNIKLAQAVGQLAVKDLHLCVNMDALDYMEKYASIGENLFDIIITDPPYGIGADTFQDAGGKMTGINHSYDDDFDSFIALMHNWCKLSFNITAEQAHAYIFCDIDNFGHLKLWMKEAGWYVFRTPLIHYKPNSGRVPLPEHGPRRQYELILYAIKGKKRVNHIYPDVISSNADESTGHGAQKPVEVYSNLLQRSARPGDRVLDTFAGSGTLIPAAHQHKCESVCIETDKASYGICLKRLEDLEK